MHFRWSQRFGRVSGSAQSDLLSGGHPIGPNGVGQICEIVTQLRDEFQLSTADEAGRRQHPGVGTGAPTWSTSAPCGSYTCPASRLDPPNGNAHAPFCVSARGRAGVELRPLSLCPGAPGPFVRLRRRRPRVRDGHRVLRGTDATSKRERHRNAQASRSHPG